MPREEEVVVVRLMLLPPSVLSAADRDAREEEEEEAFMGVAATADEEEVCVGGLLISLAFCRTAFRFSLRSASLERVARLPVAAAPPAPPSSPSAEGVGEEAGKSVICASRTKMPCNASQAKYRVPSMEPSFFPRPSSKAMPTHLPVANWVSPRKRTVPVNPSLSVWTRSPRAYSCGGGGCRRLLARVAMVWNRFAR